ncbi:hypothetical protein [Anabaena azotica]|uniref:Uncharacterized protein n=1 Tax=Anabaena azotica FACHB-119 TaxID=947527 RepID=A0ABR8DCP3_9NOST|nr:hypothetical protein [Anabaena azotica]MBD2504879.1 hypothetical protein [Anabaena azotica FACHB-119]
MEIEPIDANALDIEPEVQSQILATLEAHNTRIHVEETSRRKTQTQQKRTNARLINWKSKDQSG